MNMLSGSTCRSVNEIFDVYVARYKETTTTKKVFLDNYEEIVTRYIQAKFPHIRSLIVAQTSLPILDSFPAHLWANSGAVFFVYDLEKITKLVDRAFSLMVLSHYDHKSGEIKLAAYEQLSVQSKLNLETERVITKLSLGGDNLLCTKSKPLRRFITDISYKDRGASEDSGNEQLQSNIAAIWEPVNTTALSMLIILTEIVEAPVVSLLEEFSGHVKIQRPIIHINFAKKAGDEVRFLPSRLAPVRDVYGP